MSITRAPLSRSLSLSIRAACGFCLAATLFVGTSGCDKGSKEAANSVSGKVTLGSDKVAGSVFFIGPDGKEKSTPIQVDGIYVLADPPQGNVKILVKGMGVAPVGGMAPPKDAPAMPKSGGVAPPAKYGDAKTSDLTYDVKAGKHTHNIDLKP